MPERPRNSYNLIAAIIAIIAIIAIGTYLYTRSASTYSDGGDTGNPIDINGVLMSGGTGTVDEISPEDVPAPDYRSPLTFTEDVPQEVRDTLNTQYNESIEILESDALDFNAWNGLAILRKVTDDYKGAEEIWIYLALLYPQSTIPFDNLGSLYLDFLHDYPKAEASFKQAIAVNTHNIHAYQQLVSLYTVYGYKDIAAARTLLEEGLADNPNDQTLLDLRAQLQAQ